MQPARGVDQDDIGLHLDRGPHRVKRHGGRVRTLPVGTNRGDADPLAPGLQLVCGSCPEGVCGAEYHVLVLSHQDSRQLADRRGLARPVHPDDHHDRRTALHP